MGLDFNMDRWARVKENNRLWRERKLGRPLVQWKLSGADPGRPAPETPYNHKGTTSFDRSYSIDQIMDRWDYDLSCTKYLGDAFPSFWPDFGPGIAAEFLGGRADPSNGTVWFYPGKFEGMELKDIHLEYSESSAWLERVIQISKAAIERFEGMAQVGMTDLGGTLDILASLRPAEELLIDLYDNPEEVERLVWEIHPLWFKYYDLINDALKGNPGYSAWADVFSNGPEYMLQCDFSYMIGPEMFDRFVLPELAASCKRLTGGPFYHQDGIGELPHTASLHSIPELAGMQWQPGDGQPPSAYWFDQQRRIRDDGKLSQTWGGPDELEALINNVGDISNTVLIGHGHVKDEARFREVLKKYNIAD
jgi:hypothetical protein